MSWKAFLIIIIVIVVVVIIVIIIQMLAGVQGSSIPLADISASSHP